MYIISDTWDQYLLFPILFSMDLRHLQPAVGDPASAGGLD